MGTPVSHPLVRTLLRPLPRMPQAPVRVCRVGAACARRCRGSAFAAARAAARAERLAAGPRRRASCRLRRGGRGRAAPRPREAACARWRFGSFTHSPRPRRREREPGLRCRRVLAPGRPERRLSTTAERRGLGVALRGQAGGAGPPRPLPPSVRASVSAPVALRPGAVGGRGARMSVLAPNPELAARGGHSVGPRGGSCLTGCAAGDAGLPSLLCCLVDYETPR